MNLRLLRWGNRLYSQAYFLYRPLYSLYKAFSDRRERTILRDLIRPGMTVVDIGANIGIYTRFLSKLVGIGGRVVAFEPDPLNFRRLSANVRALSNVEPVNAAVSDRSGEIGLFLSNDLNVDHQTYDAGEARERVAVRAVSLDDYFDSRSSIDVIKLDVQGYEYHVLRGAQRLLKDNSRIIVLMEFWPYGLRKAGVEPRALVDLIMAGGFTWRRADALDLPSLAGNLPMTTNDRGSYCNLLLTRHA